MGTSIIVGGIVVASGVGFAVGLHFGRAWEQKAVATVLMEFGKVDVAARSLVNRCYTYMSDGVKTELKKLGL